MATNCNPWFSGESTPGEDPTDGNGQVGEGQCSPAGKPDKAAGEEQERVGYSCFWSFVRPCPRLKVTIFSPFVLAWQLYILPNSNISLPITTFCRKKKSKSGESEQTLYATYISLTRFVLCWDSSFVTPGPGLHWNSLYIFLCFQSLLSGATRRCLSDSSFAGQRDTTGISVVFSTVQSC